MADHKKSDPMEDIEGAFKVATNILGLAGPLSRALGRATGTPQHTMPSPPPPSPSEHGCYVCSDTLQAVMNGKTVPCPSCVVEQPKCKTCGGSGKVGNPGHQARCPVCQGR